MYCNLLSERKKTIQKIVTDWKSNLGEYETNKSVPLNHSTEFQYTLDFSNCSIMNIEKKNIIFKTDFSDNCYKKILVLEKTLETILGYHINSIVQLSDSDEDDSFKIDIQLSNILNLKKINDVIDKSKDYRILFNIDRIILHENKIVSLLFKILEIEELVVKCNISMEEDGVNNYIDNDIDDIYPNYEDILEMKNGILDDINVYENKLGFLKKELVDMKSMDILTINAVASEFNNLFGKL